MGVGGRGWSTAKYLLRNAGFRSKQRHIRLKGFSISFHVSNRKRNCH